VGGFLGNIPFAGAILRAVPDRGNEFFDLPEG
jgi:hypothetical protein